MADKSWGVVIPAKTRDEKPRSYTVEAATEQEAWDKANAEDSVVGHSSEPTWQGAVGAVTRGAAPIAAGTALGAAFGAPLVGVGAIPGAAMGAAATGLEELGGTAYNALAPHMGLPHYTTFGENINKGLDVIGTPRPSNPFERVLEAGSGGATSATGTASALGNIASRMSPSVSKNVLTKMSEQPIRQGVSGLSGGATTQGALEAGVNPLLASAAGFGASAIPFIDRGSGALPHAKTAIERGYKIPPTMASENPSRVADTLGAISNDTVINRDATFANQKTTNSYVKQDLGIPDNVPISKQTLERVRQDKGVVYTAVRKVPGQAVDPDFVSDVNNISGPLAKLKAKFPDIATNNDLDKLVASLNAGTSAGGLSSDEAVSLSRLLRSKASKNILSDKPEITELGHAQKDAAEAIEQLLERRMAQSGNHDLAEQWKSARTAIAQSHYVEDALNPATGNVDATKLAAINSKGDANLTGGLSTAANVGGAFPAVSGLPEGMGVGARTDPRAVQYALPIGLGGMGGAGAFMYSHDIPTALVAGATMSVAPKLARALSLSGPYQRAIAASPAKEGYSDYAKSAAALLQTYPYLK